MFQTPSHREKCFPAVRPNQNWEREFPGASTGFHYVHASHSQVVQDHILHFFSFLHYQRDELQSVEKELAQKTEENYSFLKIGTFFRYYLVSSFESPRLYTQNIF